MFAKSRKKARFKADADIALARKKAEKALRHYRPPGGGEYERLHWLTTADHVRGHLPLCNFVVRRAASRALIDAVLQHFGRVRHDAQVRHFFFTACVDDGLTFEHSPVLQRERLKRTVRRALQSLRLNAVCVFEVDVLRKPLPGEDFRRLSFHVHAICWTSDPEFAPRAAEERLQASRCFRNSLGTRPVTFVTRAKSAAKWNGFSRKQPERDQIASSMAHLAYYMLKAPNRAKNRYWSDGRWRMRYDERAFRLNTALRMAEIWSHFSPFDAVFGVGAGSAVCADFRQRIRTWAKNAPADAPTIEKDDLDGLWRGFFADHAKLRHFETSVIR